MPLRNINSLVVFKNWPPNCRAAAAIPGVIKSIALSQLTYDFTAAAPWAPLVSSSAVVTLSFPAPPVTAVVNHIQIFDKEVEIAWVEPISRLFTVSGSRVTTSFKSVPYSVLPTAHDAFSGLFTSLFTSQSKTLTLKGASDVTFTVPFLGDRTIPGFAFKNDNVFVGLSSFPDVKFVRFTSEENAHPNTYASLVQINLKNLSSLKLILGNLVFDVAGFIGTKIGFVNFKDVTLEQGDNIVTMDISIDLTLPAGIEFMTSIGVAEAAVTLLGVDDSSPNVAMIPALKALHIKLVIPKNFGKT
ncbi:hypothetical protein BG006_009886 [Podila minutissima]|uniref:Uncharacterized protein n=1 Tax=Podila minutissima TaxID=64525 RepID=A0A9P5VJ41_9FUNG|nr:hypothetical protein BG006_009886 [Podila minutissima]